MNIKLGAASMSRTGISALNVASANSTVTGNSTLAITLSSITVANSRFVVLFDTIAFIKLAARRMRELLSTALLTPLLIPIDGTYNRNKCVTNPTLISKVFPNGFKADNDTNSSLESRSNEKGP